MQLRNSNTISCFDAIFSYSKLGINAFKFLDANSVFWCPLAGDDDLHNLKPRLNSENHWHDLSFIGNYSPEREEVWIIFN